MLGLFCLTKQHFNTILQTKETKMQLESYKETLNQLKSKLAEIEQAIKIDQKQNELAELEKQEQDPSLWQDPEKMKKHAQKKRAIEKVLQKNDSAKNSVNDLEALIQLAEECDIDEQEIKATTSTTQKAIDELWLETLLSGKYDACSCVLTLHAGAGGEEAQDWTEMLSRMYLRYAEKQGYTATILDTAPGDGAGLKSQAIQIDGANAYGYLKCEKGVHRLVRLSPFDAANRRHTSFSSVEVSPLIEDAGEVEIRAEDLKIDTYRAGGAGGQHVNRTDSAVRITHIPTGIVVQCQNERSQIQNKEQAMNVLRGRLAEKAEEERLAKMQAIVGESKKIEWGSQIRSYVLHPYNMVKDHRTGEETSNTSAVLDGEIQPFIVAELKRK